MFAFTSMGGKVDKAINKGRGPYVFRLGGQNFHRLGSLLPTQGSTPKFLQLYICDTDNELDNRKNVVRSASDNASSSNDTLDPRIISDLKDMLDVENPLVISYRMARDRFNENDQQPVKLRLLGTKQKDGRTHNLPTASEVAAIIIGDIDSSFDKRDIVVETQDGSLKCISELHPLYLPLQYPLLFPKAEDGWRLGIKHKGLLNDAKGTRTDVTIREFFTFIIQDRPNVPRLLLLARKLFQQFLVDAYTMIESQKFHFYRTNQKKFRCDSYHNLAAAVDDGNTEASSTSKRIKIPSSFTGGPRYMMQKYLDAMALCKTFGYLDLFITVTCNPKWPEITRFLEEKKLSSEDRPDVLCRVFKMKLDQMIEDFKKNKLFGSVLAVVYTVEFQKRGLPHAHICLFLDSNAKFPTTQDIDKMISAEIPDKDEDPELYQLVRDFMIHGPCVVHNAQCPCMTDQRKCSKRFPKSFVSSTTIDKDGYPIYMRRDNGNVVEKSGVALDNGWVVPYNKFLLKRYQAHINVEWCNQYGAIKYLFKYINKGPDRVTATIYQGNNNSNDHENVDEIKAYYDCRYISACEACWRIFAFDIHYRIPSVERLPFHLEGEQQVVYEDDADLSEVVNKPSVASSMFTAWMDRNKHDSRARELTYVEFPKYYVWKAQYRSWEPRKQGMSIGRIHYVPPSLGDVYYLRMLLNKVKGPTSWKDMCTVNGKLCNSYKEACYALGLLDDDKEYVEAIEEASEWAKASYLRLLFAMMLLSNSISRPESIWSRTWNHLSEDILYSQRKVNNNPGLVLSDDELKKYALYEIEKILRSNGSSLKYFKGMPLPDDGYILSYNNRLIHDELDYNREALQAQHVKFLESMTAEQKRAYETIISAVDKDEGGVFFLYGYGGTGKTFVWKTLSAALCSKGEIVLNVASSGIAAILLSGGRTAHSRFMIPININEESFCSISQNSDLADLLKKAKLIIWDEAPMMHKHCFEALDRTMRDILRSTTPGSEDKLFGGKVVVFGGDFRQILPIIPKGTRHDIVNASLNSSYIWDHCRVLELTVNMRLQVGAANSNLDEVKKFADWILDVVNGTLGEPNDGEVEIEFPDELIIKECVDPAASIVSFAYKNILDSLKDDSYFQDRAILTPTHEIVDTVNDRLLSMIPGEEKVYLSSDNVCESEQLTGFQEALFSPDCLKFPGLPHHRLALKVGVPIMLLRNIDQPNGLCNGTRLQVTRLGKNVIEAKIITGTKVGEITLIPRMRLTPSDKRIPFKIIRKQFPVTLCFAMTINKSQGQSFSRVGLYLPSPVFTHGQLYVAVSRVTSKDGLKVVICDGDGNTTNKTTNVVYKEVLQKM